MKSKSDTDQMQRMEEAKILASHMLHMHYCEHDMEGVTSYFSPQFSWLGTGEEEYLVGRDACVRQFLDYRKIIPACNIWGEEYDAACPIEGLYIVMGRLWVATDPSAKMYLKAHQRITFVFQDTDRGLMCAHIHCSNPYQEMVAGEHFPERIGRQSYDYVQERLRDLEAETRQQSRQLEVIMSSIAGGLKISNDDDTYSFAFVSREAAALFGYTVEEFMEVTGGTAVGNVYPPDLPGALADCQAAFCDGGLTYSIRYRVRCKDGSLKWVIDSGKKARDARGNWMVNSLYLDITRSEEDAARLREQTRLLTSIYDTVPCGIIRFLRCRDGSYRLISLNKAVLSLMGYDSMEDGLKDWKNGVLGVVREEERLGLQEMYQRLKHVGDREDSEYRVTRKDGSICWLEGTSMVVGITSEGEDIIQRTMVEITQRKTLQRQLEREQDMYRVAMEVSSSIMFEYLMDEDLFISYEPRAGQGVLRNELKHYSRILWDQQIVHPDDIPTVIDNICNGRSEVFEVRCSTPDGEKGKYIWHRVNSRLIMEHGRPCRVVGALHNIHTMKSELSVNSRRLYMNQSALQAINGVYVSIFYVDLREDSYYAVRLPEACKGTALPRTGSYSDGLCGYILGDVDQDDRKRVADICDREWLLGQLSGDNEHIEVEFRQKQPVMWLRLEIHQMAAKDGDTRNVIIALRNISVEKQKELEYYEDEKSAKRALEEAYASLTRASEAKSDFLSRMSHDIRTPMNAILGMTSIAEKSLGNDVKVADCLSKISLSGIHLLKLINKVLDMSKIESGSVSLSEDMFCLRELLAEVSQIIQPDIDHKGQHYCVHADKVEHSVVYGDAVRVKQILLNLLSNAVKYTGEGGHITVYLEEKLSSDSGVGCFEFAVEDDGIGIPQEFVERLFQPFERGEDSRISQTQGTGLGLAITRSLIQMMNGTIRVESRLDRGTRFTAAIFLKLVEDNEVPDGQLPGGGSASQASFSRASFPPDTRILLAEDNDLNREIVVELLSMYGLTIVCAVNGQEAVDRFRSDPPGTYAVILMDIQMPVLDGYGAARAIRSLGETGERPDGAGIPIIALTANAFADDAYRARQAGMNEHVTKPLEINRLLEIIQRLLE